MSEAEAAPGGRPPLTRPAGEHESILSTRPVDATPGSVASRAGTTHAAIVLAAGSSTRVGDGRNKAYLPLAGRPIVVRSLEPFRNVPGIGRLVLVVRAEDRDLAAQVLDRELPGVPVDLVTGGQTRHESEYRALLHLAEEIGRGAIDVVLVHDAARPLAPPKLVEEVLATAIRTGSAVPAVPLESLVGVDEEGRMSPAGGTGLVGVQTPQAFKASRLLAAYQAASADGFTGTDTAACLERYEGVPVQVVDGDPRNIKVTYADDLVTAELIIRMGSEGTAAGTADVRPPPPGGGGSPPGGR
jgi:2-C-methyl-D-erythritol 4-phosphate cytidylyltransferase